MTKAAIRGRTSNPVDSDFLTQSQCKIFVISPVKLANSLTQVPYRSDICKKRYSRSCKWIFSFFSQTVRFNHKIVFDNILGREIIYKK